MLSLTIGIVIGFRTVPEFVAVPFILLSIACIYFAFQNEVSTVLSILPYLIYTEMFIRSYVHALPYLSMQYLFIAVFGILFLQNGVNAKFHSKSAMWLVLFTLVEIVNSTRAADQNIGRSLVINTISLTVVVIWACSNVIKPIIANKCLTHIKYASIYLCGMILARYLMGDIVYSGVSSSEATNGLAPVQISGYLGFSSAIFFLSIMNDQKRLFKLILNIAFFGLTSIIMILSFSRGGLYFLAVIMFLYFYYNRTQVRSYFIFLLLIPCGLLIYYYVTSTTNGLIEERYAEEGSSGRSDLIVAGWRLFISQPLAGVGTGNFNEEIKSNQFYNRESGAHNEFVRVMAEDGIIGLISYFGFFAILFFEIIKRRKIQREYAIYFLIFFCMIVVHNGLKISLQPILLMLAIATPSLITVKKKNVPVRVNPAVTN